MTWEALHRRGEVLRAVIDEANTRPDGTLPVDLSGVAETFGNELELIGALQRRWRRTATALVAAMSGPPGVGREHGVRRTALT